MSTYLLALPPQVFQTILEDPALTPPPGITPKFDHPPNRNGLAYATAAVTVSLSSICFLFRLYSRLFCLKKVRFEDLLVLVAYGLATANTWALSQLMRHPGYFVHQWDVRVKDLEPLLYAHFISTNFYLSSILSIKAAIILEWLRIFNPSGERNTFFWLGYAILVLNTLFYASAIFVENFTCFPQEKIWDKTIPGGCIDVSENYIITAAFNVFSDIVILALPQRVVWKLKMTTKRKISVSLVFAVGILTCIVAIIRVYSSTEFVAAEDQVYALSTVSLLAHIETHSSLLVICIPAVPSVTSKIQLRSKLKGFFKCLSPCLPKRDCEVKSPSMDSLHAQDGSAGQDVPLSNGARQCG
ncbi:hypothetical protein O1611_g3160 [Lasiodiplodia mahajangana]|uniref:Uncharacterized protein n=1 Tax=Lasiodiplodia mahajangana TaxID=1108764 RepID=A0ACC2JSK2_9PEZI|nr:hypothetical protein O1611_g3160 [Lasiodiplodia mahajangana]